MILWQLHLQSSLNPHSGKIIIKKRNLVFSSGFSDFFLEDDIILKVHKYSFCIKFDHNIYPVSSNTLWVRVLLRLLLTCHWKDAYCYQPIWAWYFNAQRLWDWYLLIQFQPLSFLLLSFLLSAVSLLYWLAFLCYSWVILHCYSSAHWLRCYYVNILI